LGYQVVAKAANGQKAVSLARQLRPDVMVMDIEMPHMDGLETRRQIDQEGLCPIILLSAYTEPELTQKVCSRSVVQAYLIKPVTARDLEPAIELAVHRFLRLKRLQCEPIRPNHSADACSVLERAIECVVANHHCSLQEAHGWLLREAVAEKIPLERLAWEIVAGDKD
jgi:response regulator NasT